MGLGEYDIGVIGGGIIGLATAMTLTRQFPQYKVAVLEKEPEVARHQTGHNSGVIHAGIYYAQGTKKASFCSEGGKMLRRFCDEHGIEYRMCGKLIVATKESELPRLHELHARGKANGAQGLELVGAERIREMEPNAAGIRAIFSPNTGIVDYSQVARSLLSQVLESGGDLYTDTALLHVTERDGRQYLETSKGEMPAKYVVNCAGLQADTVARRMGLKTGLRIIPFRGEYFTLKAKRSHVVKGLIYPVPNPKLPFLGVHFTKRVDGSVEAGPNAVLAFAREGYGKADFDPREVLGILGYPGFWRISLAHWKTGLKEQYRSWVKRSFVRSLQTLVPEIEAGDLGEPGAGVRAQAVARNGELVQDFNIVGTARSIHVLNAPSPAATACLAIGKHIAQLAQRSFGLKG